MKSQNSISDFLSNKIGHYMALLTLFVVFIHYSSSFVGNVTGEIPLAIVDYFGQCVTRNSVPLFFFMSGILAFIKVQNRHDLVIGAKKRIYSLGIPYLIWNTIAMIFFLLLDILIGGGQYQISVSTVIEGVFYNKFLGPFWYILYLLILSLLAPFLYELIKIKSLALLLIGVLCVLHLLDFFSWGVVYYILGGFLAINYSWLLQKRITHSTITILLAFWGLLQIIRIMCYDSAIGYVEARHTMPYLTYELLSPITMWFAFDFVRYESVEVRKFEKHTFIIYAAHYMLVSVLTGDMIESHIHLPNDSQLYTMFLFFFIPVVIYTSLACISMLLKNKVNFIYKLLTGGR